MNKANRKRLQEKWFKINEPTGKALGYPDCCIKAFGDNAPELMTGKPPKEVIQRYNAGCINGVFTGFIPCIEHAKQIIHGKIKLTELIKNRKEDLPPFPFA
jgi:hypothetical protein